MNLQLATHKDVHSYPTGAMALGRDLGWVKLKTFLSKADPGQPHEFTLSESIAYQLKTGSYHTLHAYNAELNHIALPVVDMTGLTDTALIEALLNHSMKFGETRQAILDALSDGDIEPHELETILHRMFESMRAQAEVFRRLACMCADDSALEDALQQWGSLGHA
ncbi:MAG: hypothetical protein HUJ30_00665 [Gammaproteobacteria bacterium]|nr:hypothetical protein [Gammaproteobacteria bacterium]